MRLIALQQMPGRHVVDLLVYQANKGARVSEPRRTF